MKLRVWYLVECWLKDEGFEPVGVWYFIEGHGLDFWFYPEYEHNVEYYDILGPRSQQMANKFAELARTKVVDIHDPSLLMYYSSTGGQRIDRVGPFEVEVEVINNLDEFDPEQLIELGRNGEAVQLKLLERLFQVTGPT